MVFLCLLLLDLGDGPAGFEVGGQSYGIANAFGETDLLTCPHGCTMSGGFYDLTHPRSVALTANPLVLHLSSFQELFF